MAKSFGSGDKIPVVPIGPVVRTDKPLSKYPYTFPVWLSVEEALAILDLVEQGRLMTLESKIYSAAHAQKAGSNPVMDRLRRDRNIREGLIDPGNSGLEDTTINQGEYNDYP